MPDEYDGLEEPGGGSIGGGFGGLWGPGSAEAPPEEESTTAVASSPIPVDVPHFKFPFRVAASGRRVMVVEQDSDDEVLDCVEVTLRTRPGDRLDEPEFGLEDQAFVMYRDDNMEEVVNAVRVWEPRARTYIASQEIADLVERVRLNFVEGGRGRVRI